MKVALIAQIVRLLWSLPINSRIGTSVTFNRRFIKMHVFGKWFDHIPYVHTYYAMCLRAMRWQWLTIYLSYDDGDGSNQRWLATSLADVVLISTYRLVQLVFTWMRLLLPPISLQKADSHTSFLYTNYYSTLSCTSTTYSRITYYIYKPRPPHLAHQQYSSLEPPVTIKSYKVMKIGTPFIIMSTSVSLVFAGLAVIQPPSVSCDCGNVYLCGGAAHPEDGVCSGNGVFR